MISEKYLNKFKTLYLKKFYILLSDEEATRAAIDLLNLMKVILELDTE